MGDVAAGGRPLGGLVAEHAGRFGVAGRPPRPVRDRSEGDAGEQALQNGVAPGVRIELGGGVRADGGADEAGVVAPQGVRDEVDGMRSFDQGRQRPEYGAPFGAAAVPVEPGQGLDPRPAAGADDVSGQRGPARRLSVLGVGGIQPRWALDE